MRRLLLAVLLGLTTACHKKSDPASVAYWAEQAQTASKREEAMRELGKLGKPDAAPILRGWLDQPGPWQGDAAFSLAQLRDPGAADALVAHLDYQAGSGAGQGNVDRVYTNLGIIRGLALLRAQAAVPALLKMLANPEIKTREATVNALGAIGAPPAVRPLMDLLKPGVSPLLAQTTVRALGSIGGPEAVTLLIQSLYDDALFDDARQALLQVGPAAEQPLIDALEGHHAALEGLKQVGGAPLPLGEREGRAAAPLGAMRAQRALTPIAAALERLLTQYTASPKETQVTTLGAIVELAYALGNLGGPIAVHALLPLTRAPVDTLQVAAAEALTAAGPDPASTAALLAAAQNASAEARPALAVAVTRLGDGEALGALQKLSEPGPADPAPTMMAGVLERSRPRLLAAQECHSDVACWRQKLHDVNPAVRDRAAYELGWLGAHDALPDLLQAVEDDAVEVRMAAVLSLHRLGGADVAQLQRIYDTWATKVQFRAVNQELLSLIARSKAHAG